MKGPSVSDDYLAAQELLGDTEYLAKDQKLNMASPETQEEYQASRYLFRCSE